MNQKLKQTPFAASYPDGVVEWVDVFGYAVPLTWGDPGVEHGAVRNQAAAMEFSMLLKFDVEGSGAVETVDRIFSRDVVAMSPGHIAYGVVVNEDGKMVDDCTVFVHGAEHVRVFGGNPQIGDFLESAKHEDVTVTQRREELAQLSVQGPNSRDILQKLTDSDISKEALPYYQFLTDVQMAGIDVQVSRLGFTGELGFEIIVPIGQAGGFWNALFEVGTPMGLLPAGAAVVMMCRVEAGMIMAELEYDHTMTPYECRMGWAVDLGKDNFQGKSALLAARDNPGLAVISVIFSDQGEFDGAVLSLDGEEIGHVTMAIPSPYLEGQILGLARVQRGRAPVGATFVVGGDNQCTATVVQTPVYDPDRIRVRS